MSETYEIILEPDPRLHRKSLNVESVSEEEREIFDKLLVTLENLDGLGLAAAQVGILKKLLIINDKRHVNETLYMANAEVISSSDSKTPYEEYCFSVYGVGIEVERPETVRVKYLNYHNEECEEEFTGFLAKIVQHEIDHTNGIVITDYVKHRSKLKHLMLMKKLSKSKVRLKNEQGN